MKKVLLLFIFLTSLLMVFSVAQTSFAQTNSGGGTSGGIKGGLNDLKTKTGDSYPSNVVADDATLTDVFAKVLNWALGIGFAIAVIFVIYGGYKYITSAGNEEQATEGRKTVIYAAVGIVIIVLAFVIVRTIVNFASGTGSTSSNTPTNQGP